MKSGDQTSRRSSRRSRTCSPSQSPTLHVHKLCAAPAQIYPPSVLRQHNFWFVDTYREIFQYEFIEQRGNGIERPDVHAIRKQQQNKPVVANQPPQGFDEVSGVADVVVGRPLVGLCQARWQWRRCCHNCRCTRTTDIQRHIVYENNTS